MSYSQLVGQSYTNKVKNGMTYASKWKVWENKEYTYNNLICVLSTTYTEYATSNADYGLISMRNRKALGEATEKFRKYLYAYMYVSVGGIKDGVLFQETKNYNDFVIKKLKQALNECIKYEGIYDIILAEQQKIINSIIDDPLPALQMRSDLDPAITTVTTDPTTTGNNNGENETNININTLIVIAIIIVLIVKK